MEEGWQGRTSYLLSITAGPVLGVAVAREPPKQPLYICSPTSPTLDDSGYRFSPPDSPATEDNSKHWTWTNIRANILSPYALGSKRNDLLPEKQMQIKKSHAPRKTEPRQFNHSFNKHIQSVNNVPGKEQGSGLSLPEAHTPIIKKNKIISVPEVN